MLSKFNNSRTLKDNIMLGILTAFSAGMVNISSLIIFFSFTSNITGHYAILAEEITKGNWHQVAVVFAWIFLFFFGAFTSNFIIINMNRKKPYLAHSLPIFIEMMCLLIVGVYGSFYYTEKLVETELLLSLLLFAMGLQNGLTASISNFVVKTTHMTGTMTDLGVLFSMFTKRKFRAKQELRDKAKLLSSVALFYLLGGVFAGYITMSVQFSVFYFVAGVLVVVLTYDLYMVRIQRYIKFRKEVFEDDFKDVELKTVVKKQQNEKSLAS
jgi:uncharacterized membrane protein YoaK (UPF0700 family)